MTDHDVVQRVYWERLCAERREFLALAVSRGHVEAVKRLHAMLAGDIDCAVLAGATVDVELASVADMVSAARERQGSCSCPLCRVGRS